MIDYLGFNLTQYKSFRQLQLDYCKLKDHNQKLQSRLQELKEKYQYKCNEVIQMKSVDVQQKISQKNKNFKYKTLYYQLLQALQANFSCLTQDQTTQNISQAQYNQSPNFNKQGKQSKYKDKQSSHSIKDKSIHQKSAYIHLQENQKVQKITKRLQQFVKNHIELQQKTNKYQKKLQRIATQMKSSNMQKQKTQNMIIRQVQNLQKQVQQYHQINSELEAKIHIRERQKRNLQMQCKQMRNQIKQMQERMNRVIQQLETEKQDDSEFTIDFLKFQLQSIQNLFGKVIQSTKYSPDLARLLQVLYNDYQQISQLFKQKLQIQYDLQELQQRYKMQKQQKQVQDHLLIQTRRQIQAFRLELLKQKQILRQKQSFMQEHLQEYLKINEEEYRVKKYSLELQNRLYQQKRSQIDTTCERFTSRNPTTARDILAKRSHKPEQYNEQQNYDNFVNQDNYQILSKKTSLKFKQSNNVEELMKEIIKQDKDNLEKILKETKRAKVPTYKGR